MEIVIPNSSLMELIGHILDVQEVETHAFLFGAFSSTRITIGRVWKTPLEMYDHRSAVGVELKDEYVIRALEYARHNQLALVDVHSHPWAHEANFSPTDDSYGLKNARWVKGKIEAGEFPEIPWGMIVVAGSEKLKARVYDARLDAFVPVRVRLPFDYGQELAEERTSEVFDRQVRLWGREGQQRLTRVKLAIVGAGGLGALLCEELARMGVRHFALMDGDTVELTNLNRLTGFYSEHIGRFKAEIATANIRRVVGPEAEVEVIHEFLHRDNLRVLATHDLIVGAVDREGARLLMNEVAVRYLIPYLDTATGIRTKDGTVTQMGGQVRFVNPGTTPCLQCYTDGIDAFQAALDLLSPEDVQTRRQLGYIEGTALSPEPSVIPLNGILASIAAQELSKLITGFSPPFSYINYDGLQNVIRVLDKEVELKPQKACPVCGIGGLLGLGDIEKQSYVVEGEQKELGQLFDKSPPGI